MFLCDCSIEFSSILFSKNIILDTFLFINVIVYILYNSLNQEFFN